MLVVANGSFGLRILHRRHACILRYSRYHTNFVYTEFVKNITLSADEQLIDRARQRATKENTTLNAAFREWLRRYAGVKVGRDEFNGLMKHFGSVKARRKFSRDEFNERGPGTVRSCSWTRTYLFTRSMTANRESGPEREKSWRKHSRAGMA
jgi:hypothetical protein